MEAEAVRPKIHLILVLDNSSSMTRRLESAKAALTSFYKNVERDQSATLESSWMLVFNRVVAETDFTGKHYDQILSAVQAIGVGRGTDFQGVIRSIESHFSAQQGGRFFVAFFTDGQVP